MNRVVVLVALSSVLFPIHEARAQAAAPTPTPAQGAPGEAPPAAQRPSVVLLPTRPIDVDARAADAVHAALSAVLAERGAVAAPAAAPALAAIGTTYPRSPADVWYATHATGAALGVYATVRAEGGEYVVHVTIADANGRGPYLEEASAGAEDLGRVASGALDTALTRAGFPPPAPPPGAAPTPSAPHFVPWHLALGTRGAIGLTDPGFYNHLVGARLDRRFSPELAVGLGLSYANLKGPDGRASNVLPEVQLDYRVPLGQSAWQLPLRFTLGYLPNNGPTLQLATGIAVRLSDTMDLVLDAVAPMFWMSEDLAVTSMNIGLELGIDL